MVCRSPANAHVFIPPLHSWEGDSKAISMTPWIIHCTKLSLTLDILLHRMASGCSKHQAPTMRLSSISSCPKVGSNPAVPPKGPKQTQGPGRSHGGPCPAADTGILHAGNLLMYAISDSAN